MPSCRSCYAEIIWAETERGKSMPLDVRPVEGGAFVLVKGKTRRVQDEDLALHRETYSSHFASCPSANQHRKAR